MAKYPWTLRFDELWSRMKVADPVPSGERTIWAMHMRRAVDREDAGDDDATNHRVERWWLQKRGTQNT
jgi:hypothetical protein